MSNVETSSRCPCGCEVDSFDGKVHDTLMAAYWAHFDALVAEELGDVANWRPTSFPTD